MLFLEKHLRPKESQKKSPRKWGSVQYQISDNNRRLWTGSKVTFNTRRGLSLPGSPSECVCVSVCMHVVAQTLSWVLTQNLSEQKATCHDSARHDCTWLLCAEHKQPVPKLLKQSLQPPAPKVSDKKIQREREQENSMEELKQRVPGERRCKKWTYGTMNNTSPEGIRVWNVWGLKANCYLLKCVVFGCASEWLNDGDSLLVASCYLVPRRVSRECACVCKGNLVWLSLCQTANRGIFLKSTLGCGLQWAHEKRGAKKPQLKCVLATSTGTPSIPPEQILRETSLPANLIHKHSRAHTKKKSTF